jgi:acetyl esterase/lipase
MVKDVKRALRFIRHEARTYGIDLARIGITGSSAGGNISLLVATTADEGDKTAKDPVDQESSRVQAVAVFFPITDWLNIGKPGVEYIVPSDHPRGLGGGFGYLQLNPGDGSYERITDRAKLRETAKSISPIQFISKDDPPMLLWHGDADGLVPLQQSESFVAKAKETGLDVKLLVKPRAGHGWADMAKGMEQFADWFDQKLKVGTARVSGLR